LKTTQAYFFFSFQNAPNDLSEPHMLTICFLFYL
jgi:hypothetical protein